MESSLRYTEARCALRFWSISLQVYIGNRHLRGISAKKNIELRPLKGFAAKESCPHA